MRKRVALVIRRDDHKRDALGSIFLDVVTDVEEIRQLLERYLGAGLRVVDFERHGSVLRATVECPRFEVESQNLVRMGRGLARKGRRRAALDMFTEALRLDPLSGDAFKAIGALKIAQRDRAGAENVWVRAGEISGYDGEILRGLAAIALEEDRRPTAMRYLEEALRVNPEDVDSRTLFDELKRQIELRFERSRGE